MYSQYPQPQPYPPPQQQPQGKKPNYWLMGCLGCGGGLALLIGIIVIIAVVLNNGDDSDASAEGDGSPPAASTDESAESEDTETPADTDEPVSIVAESVEYSPGALADGEDYVAVDVTVTNNTGETLSVNPLYFTIENEDGESKEANLVESAGQDESFEALELADGESEDGIIVFPGTSEAESITLSDVLGENQQTVDVA